MRGIPNQNPMRVVILGAGGRAGQAIGQRLARRGHQVTGVVRDAGKYRGLRDFGIVPMEADARSESALVEPLRMAHAVVVAVTPFSAPPPSFDDFDGGFYEQTIEAVTRAWPARETGRLVAIGLFATLPLSSGALVMDSADLFPPRLRPFAAAHQRQVATLRRGCLRSWAVLTPPAGLSLDGHQDAGYALVEPPLDETQARAKLSYSQLAEAVVDEVETPTVVNRQVAVLAHQP